MYVCVCVCVCEGYMYECVEWVCMCEDGCMCEGCVYVRSGCGYIHVMWWSGYMYA